MAESTAAPGRVFISYRREDTAYAAGWLFDRLTSHFEPDQVFKDVDSIELGDDFVQAITTAVGSCDVLLALIGDQWLTITDERGSRRLDDPGDFVRVEIEAALSRNVRVIPILVDGATMPEADDVPTSLAGLVRRQALELSPSRFAFDSGRLLTVLDKALAEDRVGGTQTPETREDSEPTHAPTESESSPSAGRTQRAAPDDIAPAPAPSGSSDARAHVAARRRRVLPLVGILAAIAALALVVVVALQPSDETEEPSLASSVIFEDDFTDSSSGWKEDGKDPIRGETTDGRYRIPVEAGNGTDFIWISPEESRALFPTTSENLSIEVDAQKISGGSNAEDSFGIFCRSDYGGGDYRFDIGERQIIISKFDAEVLTELEAEPIPSDVDLNSSNHLRAVCSTIDQGAAVLLELSVNGTVLADATDRDDPHLAGTIGLYVYTVGTQEVEFDNFKVKEI